MSSSLDEKAGVEAEDRPASSSAPLDDDGAKTTSSAASGSAESVLPTTSIASSGLSSSSHHVNPEFQQPLVSATVNHTAILEDCLFGTTSDTKVSLTKLRRLSSSGIHDLVGQERHNAFSWRGLSWRLLLGYLPEAVESSKSTQQQQADHRDDWRGALETKRQVYYDLVQTLFQSDYDTRHGEELLDLRYSRSTASIDSSRSNSLSNLPIATDSDDTSTAATCSIPASVKTIWKKSGRDLHILEGLTRDLNALAVTDDGVTVENGNNSYPNSDKNDNDPTLIRSALLLDEIRKDVVRTHPDLAFFVDPRLGRRRYAALERILLCACWHNESQTAYVQGMNEIVATLYYALATTTIVKDGGGSNAMSASSLAQEDWAAHAEVDTYWLFRILLEEMHAVYNRDLDDDASGIRGRLAAMETLLKKHDPEVMEHLTEHGLDASFFAIRWWTTLLSREFLLPDTMRLWDSMFASTHKDNFLRYVCVTMVMTIRDNLLKGDFSACLRLLQSYPSTHMDQLLQSTRALWIYESQITVACHKGGISLHQALDAIAPPPAIIMAFGLKAGSIHHQQQQAVHEFADIAAERVRDVAAHANVWFGKAKSSFVQWNRNRSKSSGEEVGQPFVRQTTQNARSTQSLDRTSGKQLAAQALSLTRTASAPVPTIAESSSFDSSAVDDVYLQAIQTSPEASKPASIVETAQDEACL